MSGNSTTHIDEGGQASNESKKVKCESPTAREHTHTNTLSTGYVGKDNQHFFLYKHTHAQTGNHRHIVAPSDHPRYETQQRPEGS